MRRAVGERIYAKMFHVKHRSVGGVGERRWRKWFHVKHRGGARLGRQSFYAEMFHVKHRAGGPGKHDSAKQPHAIKNRPFFSMT